MSREVHARFCERLGGQFPGATRLVVGFQHKRDAERFLDAVRQRFESFRTGPAPRQDPAHRVRAVCP